MNESSINDVTSSEGFGLLQMVFRPRVNPFNDIFATKISFKTI